MLKILFFEIYFGKITKRGRSLISNYLNLKNCIVILALQHELGLLACFLNALHFPSPVPVLLKLLLLITMADFLGGLRDLSLGGFWREFEVCTVYKQTQVRVAFSPFLWLCFYAVFVWEPRGMLLRIENYWRGINFIVLVMIRIQRLSWTSIFFACVLFIHIGAKYLAVEYARFTAEM